jgi:hypothetical protein
VKFDGKDYPAAGTMPGGADSISIKKVDANHYEATLKKAGKGVSADSKPTHAISTFDRH